MHLQDAIVAVVRRNGQFLVIRRAPDVIMPDYWAPLSGRVEPGESHEAAVARETYEEVGLRVQPIEKVWECPTDDRAFHLHWWIADAVEGALRLNADEVSDARWIRPEEFEELKPTFAQDAEFFREVLPGLSVASKVFVGPTWKGTRR